MSSQEHSCIPAPAFIRHCFEEYSRSRGRKGFEESISSVTFPYTFPSKINLHKYDPPAKSSSPSIHPTQVCRRTRTFNASSQFPVPQPNRTKIHIIGQQPLHRLLFRDPSASGPSSFPRGAGIGCIVCFWHDPVAMMISTPR